MAVATRMTVNVNQMENGIRPLPSPPSGVHVRTNSNSSAGQRANLPQTTHPSHSAQLGSSDSPRRRATSQPHKLHNTNHKNQHSFSNGSHSSPYHNNQIQHPDYHHAYRRQPEVMTLHGPVRPLPQTPPVQSVAPPIRQKSPLSQLNPTRNPSNGLPSAQQSTSQVVAQTAPARTQSPPTTPIAASIKSRTSLSNHSAEEDSDDTANVHNQRQADRTPTKGRFRKAFSSAEVSRPLPDEDAPSRPPPVRRGIFNSRLNTSTDNISISSTVSSASVMIRKLGNLGKVARRSSLMSLTKAFKRDKNPNPSDSDSKSSAATANISHITAEFESTATNGMSPAAALARKHQLQFRQQEAAEAAAQAQAHARTVSMSDIPQKGKTRRKWGLGFGSKVAQDDSPDDNSEDEDDTPTPRASMEVLQNQNYSSYNTQSDVNLPPAEDDYEPSIVGTTAPPAHRREARALRGILKGAKNFNQEDFALGSRNRTSSFDVSPNQTPTPGVGNAPLAGVLPSEAQVDGTHLGHKSTPPHSPQHVALNSPYQLPALNNSAPVLSLSGIEAKPLRSSSTPGSSRRITFAPNLSVHTTWPATVYDRRAELATCNKLTPALAQRIKEELNAFKMEEMIVHPTSRPLTQFFV